MFTATDYHYMAHALRLAQRGRFTTDPNPQVGCVIVADSKIIAEGWHKVVGGPHAEVIALQQAAERARNATVYVTLEPCSHFGRTPPCSDALINAGVDKVVVATMDPNPLVAGKGIALLREAGIEVQVGLLESQAQDLNRGFFKRMISGRPFVRCKMAMSVDGRTAMASGESKWITSVAARHDVQQLRASSSAILTGIGTVLADDPALTVRLPDPTAHVRTPLRVVVDSRFRIAENARVIGSDGHALVATARENSERRQRIEEQGGRVAVLPGQDGRVDLAALIHFLAGEQINELMLEAGPTLNGAFLEAGLIDELIIYMAPQILGSGANGLFQLPQLKQLQDRIALQITDTRAIGQDWRITAQVSKYN